MKTRTWLTLAWGMVLLVVCQRPAAAFYDPHAGRWLTRDPIEEEGDVNLVAQLGNDAVNTVDPVGLFKPDGHESLTKLSFNAVIGSLTPAPSAACKKRCWRR